MYRNAIGMPVVFCHKSRRSAVTAIGDFADIRIFRSAILNIDKKPATVKLSGPLAQGRSNPSFIREFMMKSGAELLLIWQEGQFRPRPTMGLARQNSTINRMDPAKIK